jgi:hypothetical protein
LDSTGQAVDPEQLPGGRILASLDPAGNAVLICHEELRQLYLSPRTVETHVGSMLAKLGLPPTAEDHRRVLAVLTYLRR